MTLKNEDNGVNAIRQNVKYTCLYEKYYLPFRSTTILINTDAYEKLPFPPHLPTDWLGYVCPVADYRHSCLLRR